MNVLGVDPSGNFYEGKGTTGFAIITDDKLSGVFSVGAKDYSSPEEYWRAVMNAIEYYLVNDYEIVIEDYLLYQSKSKSQINSKMETCQLIGAIKYVTNLHGFKDKLHFQKASQVKTRWTNEILVYKGYCLKNKKGFMTAETHEQINRHCMDAIRHAAHYATFRKKEK